MPFFFRARRTTPEYSWQRDDKFAIVQVASAAQAETVSELKVRLLKDYDKDTRPTLWKAEGASQAGACAKASAPVMVKTQFYLDPAGLSISQKSHTYTLEGYLRVW